MSLQAAARRKHSRSRTRARTQPGQHHVLVHVTLRSDVDRMTGPAAPEAAPVLALFVRQQLKSMTGLARVRAVRGMPPGVFLVSFKSRGADAGRALVRALSGRLLTLSCGKQFVVLCRQVQGSA